MSEKLIGWKVYENIGISVVNPGMFKTRMHTGVFCEKCNDWFSKQHETENDCIIGTVIEL